MKKLLFFYLITILLIGLTGIWLAAGYPGILKTNYQGSFQRLHNTENGFHKNSILQRFSERIEKSQNVLIGDSEAISIGDLFVRKFGFNSGIYALSGCSFLPESIQRPNQPSGCLEFRAKIYRFVLNSKTENIFIFNRFTPISEQETLLYVTFLKSLQHDDNEIIVIGHPVELVNQFSAYATLLFPVGFNTPKQFNRTDFSSASLKWNSSLSEYIKKFNNQKIKYINTDEILFSKFPSTLKDNTGRFLYTDSTHLSLYGGEILMKYLSGS